MFETYSFMIHVVLGCAALVLIALAAGLLKRAFISRTVSVTRITDDGEQVTISSNFTVLDTYDEQKTSLFEMLKFGEDRREYVDTRFKTLLETEKAKQQGLKEVK